jgi:hypothetical protein
VRKSKGKDMKEIYLRKAIAEYEYSHAPEYEKTRMTSKAVKEGTLDFEYDSPTSDVEISMDGAWVKARVWVPNEWLDKSILNTPRPSLSKEKKGGAGK